jgi:hypothetical protein
MTTTPTEMKTKTTKTTTTTTTTTTADPWRLVRDPSGTSDHGPAPAQMTSLFGVAPAHEWRDGSGWFDWLLRGPAGEDDAQRRWPALESRDPGEPVAGSPEPGEHAAHVVDVA